MWLVLAAQYESFMMPLAVLLSLPPGLFGAFALLQWAGLENNIYAHIALVVLIGLLGMLFQLLEAWYRVDPNYLGTFLADTVLRPFIVFLTGLILYALSGKLAHRMAARHTRSAS